MEQVTVGLVAVTMGFIALAVVGVVPFKASKDKVKWLPLLLAAAVMAMTNAPALLYYLTTRDTEYFRGFTPQRILLGGAINLVFLTLWVVGYSLVALKTRAIGAGPRFTVRRPVVWALLLVTGVAYVYQYAQGYAYGYSNALYGSDSGYAGSFGIVGGTGQLFPAVAAALLIAWYRNRRDGPTADIRPVVSPKLLWLILMVDVATGLLLDMQRGDVVAPILLAGVVLLYAGHVRKTLSMFAVTVVLAMLISPVLDYLRNPALGAKNLDNLEEAIVQQHRRVGVVGSLDQLLREPARKSTLLITAAALSQNADREGFVGLTPYLGILLDPMPRVVWPNKPIPLSVDGTKDGQAMSIAGRELGIDAVLWMSGGAAGYWEFWWAGVILMGLGVGMLWGWFVDAAFARGNLFCLIIFFNNLKWGRTLVDGLDAFLQGLVVGVKILAVFWFLDLLLRSGAHQRHPYPSSPFQIASPSTPAQLQPGESRS